MCNKQYLIIIGNKQQLQHDMTYITIFTSNIIKEDQQQLQHNITCNNILITIL